MTSIGKQTDMAWLQHQPARARIPEDVWRKVRAFRRAIAPGAAQMNALQDVHQLAVDVVHKKGIGQQRAIARLVALITPTAIVTAGAGTVAWAWPEPRGPILESDNPGQRQDCIVVRYAQVERVGRSTRVLNYAWSFEGPDHAMARVLQRDPSSDLGAVLWEAHTAFMAADADSVLDHFIEARTFYLSAGNGLFVCKGISAKDAKGERFLYARAETWIAAGMARSDQQPLAPATDSVDTTGNMLFELALNGAKTEVRDE